MILLAGFCLIFAFVPAYLFVRNLPLYARLPSDLPGLPPPRCSVLIPARNEEANILEALESVLQSRDVDLDIVVLDDGSTDRTAELVASMDEPRIRLVSARPLPGGWCGKNFACQQLADLAAHPLLIYMDADVRVSRPDSLARFARFMESSGASLASGIPREITGSFMEKMVIPLIHFVLLGFLPIRRMRASTDPSFSAACGQILAVQRDAYRQVGGHASVAGSIHDAVALTRQLRKNGFTTDLFDATDSFECRMYHNAAEVWHGFGKNAHEGLGSPRLILPATLLLLLGHVLPIFVLVLADDSISRGLAAVALAVSFVPRLIGVYRFQQPMIAALLHPVGIIILLAIQWSAFLRQLRHRPSVWKGRSYAPAATS